MDMSIERKQLSFLEVIQMTWIIGASTGFGYGVVLSDVCVTCEKTGKRWDALQKAFPLGKFIVGGLAGDIGTGLSMLKSLQLFLSNPPPARDECWEPEYVSETWSREAKRMYGDIAATERVGAVHILTVGVSPRSEALGGGVPVVTIFRSPEFIPEMVVGGNKAVSIGSGAHVGRYCKELEHLFQIEDPVYLQAEVGSPGGFGRVVANMINKETALNPTEGISRSFHLFHIRLGRIETWTPNGMPNVATNWPDLLKKIEGESDADALTATVNRDRQTRSH